MVERIEMAVPLVEGPGDEMTGVFWPWIRERLLDPYVRLNLLTIDLSLPHRDKTGDGATRDFAEAILQHRVGVKCATITPDDARVTEFGLSRKWPSPNGTIRKMLDGTIFRRPIVVPGIEPFVRTWKEPVVVARHAYGDIYSGQELRIDGPGKVEMVFYPTSGEPVRKLIHDFYGPGVVMGMHNLDNSIRGYAEMCIEYAIANGLDLWFAAKDTISQIYHARFRDIFAEAVTARKSELDAAGVSYSYFLIDDAAARLPKTPGGILIALMNYDGDVWSDFTASASGSLGLMTSVLYSPKGVWEFEAAHGTVTRHFRLHQSGKPTSTNSVASIFAWTGALAKRGELDGNTPLITFAGIVERATIETIQRGTMTKDLIELVPNPPPQHSTTEGFIDAVATTLREMLAA